TLAPPKVFTSRERLRTRSRSRGQLRLRLASCEDLVDDPVLLGLLGRHDEVAVGVLLDLLQGLSRVLGEDLVQELAVAQDLLRLDLDVDGLPLGTTVR